MVSRLECTAANLRNLRVGYLGSGTINQPLQHTLLERLRDLGWIEGKNLSIDYRFAEGRYDALPNLADELVQLGVDVIVASPTPAALAAKKATQTIPIVGIGFDNPIENELIAGLARPGGNVTGWIVLRRWFGHFRQRPRAAPGGSPQRHRGCGPFKPLQSQPRSNDE